MPAASTASGPCTSGSIARRWGATRRASGSAGATSTRTCRDERPRRRDDVRLGTAPRIAGDARTGVGHRLLRLEAGHHDPCQTRVLPARRIALAQQLRVADELCRELAAEIGAGVLDTA